MANIVISQADNGKTLSLHVGESVTLRLPEKVTAGYQWVVDQIDTNKVSYTKQRDATSPQRPGGEQFCTFTFMVKEAGTVSIALKHWRPWEGDTSITARYTFILNIYK